MDRARPRPGLTASLRAFFAPAAAQPPETDPGTAARLYREGRKRVLLGVTLTYGFTYTCRLGLSVTKKPLLDLGIYSATELGLIGATFLYTYGFGKLASGFLADRVHVARFMAVGLLGSALINLLMGSTTALWLAVALWAVNGLFQGTGAPSSVVALTRWLRPSERGRGYGLWSAAHSLGEGLTFVGTAALVVNFGWRAGFFGPAIACTLVAFWIARYLWDRPEAVGLPSGLQTPPDRKALTTAQLSVFRSPAVWVTGLASACMYVSRYAVNNWGVLYLQESHGYSLMEAGGMVGLSTVAGFFGATAYGFVSDLLFAARRPPATLLFGTLEVIALALIFYGPREPWLLSLSFMLYGFTVNGIVAVLGGLFAVDIAPKAAAGAAVGFVGVMSYLGAGMQELGSGYLIEAGTTISAAGERTIDFGPVTLLWVGASVLSLLLASTLWRVRGSD